LLLFAPLAVVLGAIESARSGGLLLRRHAIVPIAKLIVEGTEVIALHRTALGAC
jgi:hypothetical protein